MSYINSTIHDLIRYSHSVTTQSTEEYSIHFHNVYEIYYFIQGDVDYLVEGKTYTPKPYSLILLSPHAFHGVRINSNVPYERYTIHFHPDLLTLSNRPLLLSSFPSSKFNIKKEVYFESTKEYHLDTLFYLFDTCIHHSEQRIQELFPTYLESLLSTIALMANTMKPLDISRPVSDSILDIIHYINEHLQEEITLDFLCNEFYISKNHLNRSFKASTGTTVYDYILHKRVILAKQLIYNGHTSTKACQLSGFGDYSNFYRAYKKILGHAPTREEISITRKEFHPLD